MPRVRAAVPAVRPARYNGGLDPSASLSYPQAWFDIFDRYLRLPDNPRTFSLYLAALILVSAGATLYVSLSAKILQTRVQITRTEQELTTIEQQNGDLIWQIARDTNMITLHTRISAAGYVPIQKREYVQMANPAALVAQQSPAAPAARTLSPVAASQTAAQHPTAAWQAFFAQHWRATPAATLTASQVSLPAASDVDPTADRWRRWWEQTVTRGVSFLHQFAGR